ncbi:MAG: RNA polymerase sigma factor WhiG [Spirochaetes bacterium]|nr:RNA polymerase sigma factor WhiG [Spirochaetota bacterium]MCK5267664.1 RNA polymerase sigma factor WhiG [Spirochaetota bacterium]
MKEGFKEVEEEELWLDYLKTKNKLIREFIAEKYAPLVKYVAGKVAIGLPNNIEFEDLIGYGVFGLLDAIEKYDPRRGIKFKTYAVTRIRGAIYDELRSIDWVPRSIRQKAKDLERLIGSMENKLGRTVKDDEIAEEMGISINDFHNLVMKISGSSVLSLSDVWYLGDDNDKISVADTIESPSSLNPDIIVEREEIKKIIYEVIINLPEKEKKVLILYYYEDLTLKEIGKILDVTESRVSQLHTKAILRLRAKLDKVRTSLVT